MARKRHPLLPVLSTVSLHEARDLLLDLDQQLQIVPPTSHELLLAAVDKVIATTEDLAQYAEGPRDLVQLDGARLNATRIIAAASGVPAARLSNMLPTHEAEPAHLVRNVLFSLILVGVASYNGTAKEIVKDFPKLQQRTRAFGRPHRDDEALLMRVWAYFLSNGDAHARRTAAIYAQCDEGLTAGETGLLYPGDVAVYANRTGLMEVPAHGTTPQRDLDLTTYGSTLIWRYMTGRTFAPGERFTYWPRNETLNVWTKDLYINMSASASGVLARIREHLGLNHNDTTAASVWMWRAETTQAALGLAAAAHVSGRKPQNLPKRLSSSKDPWRKTPGTNPATKERQPAFDLVS